MPDQDVFTSIIYWANWSIIIALIRPKIASVVQKREHSLFLGITPWPYPFITQFAQLRKLPYFLNFHHSYWFLQISDFWLLINDFCYFWLLTPAIFDFWCMISDFQSPISVFWFLSHDSRTLSSKILRSHICLLISNFWYIYFVISVFSFLSSVFWFWKSDFRFICLLIFVFLILISDIYVFWFLISVSDF